MEFRSLAIAAPALLFSHLTCNPINVNEAFANPPTTTPSTVGVAPSPDPGWDPYNACMQAIPTNRRVTPKDVQMCIADRDCRVEQAGRSDVDTFCGEFKVCVGGLVDSLRITEDEFVTREQYGMCDPEMKTPPAIAIPRHQ